LHCQIEKVAISGLHYHRPMLDKNQDLVGDDTKTINKFIWRRETSASHGGFSSTVIPAQAGISSCQ